ncbi:MAG: methylcrotonoyl-CoA carboxylase, partial [Candidatus Binatia bacterium]
MVGVHKLSSAIRTDSKEFQENRAANVAAVALLRERLESVRKGGPERHRSRHVERGKLLPRDRIDTLLDPDSPFLELS